ncbi:alkaline phosphatase family protein, partial [Kaarinaea lacus]
FEKIQENDVVISFNFRKDRPRQIIAALGKSDFTGFDRGNASIPHITCMMPYCKADKYPYLYDSEKPEITIGQVISSMGLSQFHCAETEKFAHVTYFFNGGRAEAYSGESRHLIPSPSVATYDLKPQMSASEVTDAVLKAISHGRHSFIIVNYANGDMVGHTAKRHAILSAVKTLDTEVGKLLSAAETANYSVILTADHGNCEEMVDPMTGEPHTRHTIYPVPCLVMDKSNWELSTQGGLSNVAPTVLQLMGIRKPAAMRSSSLLLKEYERLDRQPETTDIQGAA